MSETATAADQAPAIGAPSSASAVRDDGAIKRRPDCQAREIDGVVQCLRCGLGWRAGDQQPESCFPVVTFSEIWRSLDHDLGQLAFMQEMALRSRADRLKITFTKEAAARMRALAAGMRLVEAATKVPAILELLKAHAPTSSIDESEIAATNYPVEEQKTA